MCKTHRGVHSSHKGRMVSTCYFGSMRDDVEMQRQFLSECHALNAG